MTDRLDAFKALKGQLKLDLNAPPAPNKTMQPQIQSGTQMINQLLKSPELDRLSRELAQGFHSVATPTPTKLLNPPPWEVSNAQKQYAQGFLDALQHIQQLENFNYSDPPNALSSPGGFLTPLLSQPELLVATLSPILSPTTTRREFQAVLQAIMPCTSSLPSASIAQTVGSMTNSMANSMVNSIASSMADTQNVSLRVPTTSISQPAPVSLPQILPPSLSAPSSSGHSLSSSLLHSPTTQDSTVIVDRKKDVGSRSYLLSDPIVTPSFTDVKREVLTRAVSEESDNVSDQSSTTSGNPGRLLPSKDGFNELSMDEQERRKLERKRMRNRMAASKCRQKKLERIQDLEEQVSKEKIRSAQLDGDLDSLRRSLRAMQEMISYHQQKGCQTPMIYKI